MYLLKKLNEALDKAAWLWIYDSLLLGLLLGFSFWSWRVAGYAVAGLLVILLLPKVRRLYVVAWAGSWAVVWYYFGIWLLKSLETHHGFFDRFPTYAASVIFVYYSVKWMIRAVGLCSVALNDMADEPLSAPEPTEGEGTTQEALPPVSVPEVEPFDPYDILGLTPDASPTQIKESYRQQMALYHPDKVEHLGEVLKTTAHLRTLEIQQAFELLSKHQATPA